MCIVNQTNLHGKSIIDAYFPAIRHIIQFIMRVYSIQISTKFNKYSSYRSVGQFHFKFLKSISCIIILSIENVQIIHTHGHTCHPLEIHYVECCKLFTIITLVVAFTICSSWVWTELIRYACVCVEFSVRTKKLRVKIGANRPHRNTIVEKLKQISWHIS